jgi:hypothetical protein
MYLNGALTGTYTLGMGELPKVNNLFLNGGLYGQVF